MGRQINFFMMPDDIRELDKKIHEMGLVAIECEMPTPDVVQIGSLLDGKVFLKLIVHTELIDKLKSVFVEKTALYQIDYFDAPVIEFSRPYVDSANKIMKTGRLYYTTEFLNESNVFEAKPEKFIKTAESLFRWYKKHFQNSKINTRHTTRRTTDWIKQEGGQLFTAYNTSVL